MRIEKFRVSICSYYLDIVTKLPAQDNPSPEYYNQIAIHVQIKLSEILVHTALTSQLSVPIAHSSIPDKHVLKEC